MTQLTFKIKQLENKVIAWLKSLKSNSFFCNVLTPSVCIHYTNLRMSTSSTSVDRVHLKV